MSLPKIFYYDFFLGFPNQGPSAWLPLRLKLAALNYEDALNRMTQLGFDPAELMRAECFTVRAKNGATIMQFKSIGFRDTDALLKGIRKHLSVQIVDPELIEQPVKHKLRKRGKAS